MYDVYILYNVDVNAVRNQFCVLQYYFECPIVDVMCKPHGLSKRTEPYYRTPKSSLDQMKKIASVSTAKAASSKLLKEQGGEIESVRPTTLPRDRQQLSNLHSQVTTSHDSDVLYTILLECKLAHFTVDSFIRDVKAAANPQSVMFFD